MRTADLVDFSPSTFFAARAPVQSGGRERVSAKTGRPIGKPLVASIAALQPLRRDCETMMRLIAIARRKGRVPYMYLKGDMLMVRYADC